MQFFTHDDNAILRNSCIAIARISLCVLHVLAKQQLLKTAEKLKTLKFRRYFNQQILPTHRVVRLHFFCIAVVSEKLSVQLTVVTAGNLGTQVHKNNWDFHV